MTADEQAFCESWVSAHAHKWQVLNRAQWKYQFRGKTMVRFVDEVQMREEEVRPLLEYLSSDACIATLSTYDQSLGSEWKPIKAWYEIANKSVGAVHGVRLYHGLRTDAEDNDEMFLVEDGCAYKVTLEYHWNEATKPGNVEKSTSGVSIRISSILHDPDTDLYSYVVEIRERVQQDIAKYLTSETAFVKTYEEAHFGVRQNDVSATGEPASIAGGRMVNRRVSKNSDCTSDVHNTTHDAKPWIQRYDWWSGDTHHYVVKYGNQPDEFANVVVPTDADSVHKGDSINDFNLHDGQISWMYGPWRSWTDDLKFIKHGKRQNFYVTWMKPHDRRRYHRVITVQIVHIRGDAYTDYISAEMDADRNRSSDGVLATKHISTYKDKDGNLLAEWIELRGFTSEEVLCTRQCKHGNIDNDDANEKIQSLVDSFGGSSNGGNGEGSSGQVAQAIMALTNVMMAQNSFNTGIKYDQSGNAKMGDMTWMKNGENGIREWK